MMYASIDIGTNTVLLLVADVNEYGRLDVVHEAYHAPRLGRGVDKEKNLHPDSIARVLEVLSEYSDRINANYPGVKAIKVMATSAVRDAKNRAAFVQTVLEVTGLNTTILSGEEEAEYTYKGAISVLYDISGFVTVLDIGGGSTEVATGLGKDLSDRYSFNIGSVRFTERFLKHDPPRASEIESCSQTVLETLKKRPFDLPENTILAGVAGTPTSLAYMILDMNDYDGSVLNGTTISLEQVQHWIKKIRQWSSEELLERYPVVMKGRADVFLGGLIILERFMDTYLLKEVVVSTGGIRHGAILKLVEK